MPEKGKESRVRRWTEEEAEKFAKVLADPVNGFVFCLDRLALKKSSNNAVYEHIKKSFDKELAKKESIEINEKNNLNDRGNVKDC